MFRRTIGAVFVSGAISFLGACGETNLPPKLDGSTGGSGGDGGAGGTTTSSGGGGQTAGNLCANAPFIEFNTVTAGDLIPTGTQNLYRFKGQKGQVIELDVDAQYLNGTSFDVTVIDSILTLYDDAGNQIARNDDPIEYSTNDSRIYTILPKSGEYCIGVADCWTVLNPLGITCGGEKDKLVTQYSLWIERFFDNQGDDINAEVEAGDAPSSAIDIPYVKDSNGGYLTTFWGTYKSESDVDVYQFAFPVDAPISPEGRPVGSFNFMPTGPDENGSTAKMGKMWVTEAATPNQILALVNADVNPSFRPRLELGKSYFLFVTRAPGAPSTNDFYFVRHYALGSAPIELEKGSGQNDTRFNAEVLTLNPQTQRFYVEGDLLADVDYFKVDVPPGKTRARAYCAAAIYGSGLRGLTLSLEGANAQQLQGSYEAVENGDEPAQVVDAPIGNNTKVFVRVEAGAKDPAVASTYYGCTIGFGS